MIVAALINPGRVLEVGHEPSCGGDSRYRNLAAANGQRFDPSSFAVTAAAEKVRQRTKQSDMKKSLDFPFPVRSWMVRSAVFAAVWMTVFSATAAEFSVKTSNADCNRFPAAVKHR